MVKEEISDVRSLKGVGSTTATKLEDSGYGTMTSIAVSTPEEIASVTGMSENTARKLIKEARQNIKLGFEIAKSYIEKNNKIKKIGTGCKAFDKMLGGGFESGSITEIFARWGSGKTQLAHLMLVRTIAENKNNKAILIDTEGTFRSERIKDFTESNNLDYEDTLKRIFIGRAFNTDHQILLVDEFEKMLQKDKDFKILVIDSLTSHFRSEYSGRGTLATRQQKLNKHLHQILKIADIYNLIVIVTNQVQSDPAIFYGNPEKPIGGNILGHASTNRIYMRPGQKGTIYAKLVDSPYLPQTDCNFLITKEGFKDIL